MAKKPTQKENMLYDTPSFCDYFCKFAKFSDPNSIGACRKELAVWCSKLNRYNNKNNKCLLK